MFSMCRHLMCSPLRGWLLSVRLILCRLALGVLGTNCVYVHLVRFSLGSSPPLDLFGSVMLFFW